MNADLPPHVQAEVGRILDAAARRVLREEIKRTMRSESPKHREPPWRANDAGESGVDAVPRGPRGSEGRESYEHPITLSVQPPGCAAGETEDQAEATRLVDLLPDT